MGVLQAFIKFISLALILQQPFRSSVVCSVEAPFLVQGFLSCEPFYFVDYNQYFKNEYRVKYIKCCSDSNSKCCFVTLLFQIFLCIYWVMLQKGLMFTSHWDGYLEWEFSRAKQKGRPGSPTPEKEHEAGAMTRSRSAHTLKRVDWSNLQSPAHDVSCTNGCAARAGRGGAGAGRAASGLLK